MRFRDFPHAGCLWELPGCAGAPVNFSLSAIDPFTLFQDFSHYPKRYFSCNRTTSFCYARFCLQPGRFRVLPAGFQLYHFHIIRVLPGSTCPSRGN